MTTSRKEEKTKLTKEMKELVLDPLSFNDKYNISLFNRDRTLDYPEYVTISIPRKIDNMLRNYAHHNQKLVSKRLEEFLDEEHVKKLLTHKKGSVQRKLRADVASVRWHYSNRKVKRIEAILLLKELCPEGKVAQELIEELEAWEREQKKKNNFKKGEEASGQ